MDLDKKIAYKLFISFLIENKIYTSYIRCINNHRISYFYNIKSVLNVAPSCLISRTFIWDKTFEGYDFWSKISNKWKKYYRLHEKKYRFKY